MSMAHSSSRGSERQDLRLFAARSMEEKRSESFGWIWIAVVFLAVAAVGFGAFLNSDAPGGETWRNGARWIGLAAGVCAAYLCLQALFHVIVEAAIGSERFLALALVGIAAGGAWTLFGMG